MRSRFSSINVEKGQHSVPARGRLSAGECRKRPCRCGLPQREIRQQFLGDEEISITGGDVGGPAPRASSSGRCGSRPAARRRCRQTALVDSSASSPSRSPRSPTTWNCSEAMKTNLELEEPAEGGGRGDPHGRAPSARKCIFLRKPDHRPRRGPVGGVWTRTCRRPCRASATFRSLLPARVTRPAVAHMGALLMGHISDVAVHLHALVEEVPIRTGRPRLGAPSTASSMRPPARRRAVAENWIGFTDGSRHRNAISQRCP